MGSNDKRSTLDLAMKQIEKQFGKGSIMRLGDGAYKTDIETIPTGSLSLDIALGIGGVPRGRVIEIFGPESSGKTTLALHMVAEAQKLGGTAAFIDAEHALDLGYARNLGVNADDLLLSQPDTGEQALEIAEMLIRSGAVDIIIIDSVAALVPRAEIEGGDGRFTYGAPGAADEPGVEKACRHHKQEQDLHDLHQPDQDENWGHVRESGDNDWGERPQVLCQCEARYTTYRTDQTGGECYRKQDKGASGEEQACPPLQGCGV